MLNVYLVGSKPPEHHGGEGERNLTVSEADDASGSAAVMCDRRQVGAEVIDTTRERLNSSTSLTKASAIGLPKPLSTASGIQLN